MGNWIALNWTPWCLLFHPDQWRRRRILYWQIRWASRCLGL